MLEISSLELLKNKKNLLAFSGGADSTALFFLLLKQNIKFDIAIVNYNERVQSIKEVEYAKELASKYNLECHTLVSPKISKNFESKAREIRYDFFEKLISEYGYDNLLTAHHLGDRFEWMLMQFCKGAGCAEIAGMQKVQQREFYTLVRPLLHLDKQELYEYLGRDNIKYFEDETNLNETIKRNSFRHNYSAPLLDKYLSGIKKSFDYLDDDRETLIPEVEIRHIDDLSYFKSMQKQRADIFIIDKILKSKLYMLSANERELLKDEKSLVVGRKFLVSKNKGFIFIVPYSKDDAEINMSHEFKEECRILKIEPKIRPYLYKNEELFRSVKELLN
ncbi:tRNA(Ile)-lysidine synthetase [Sulfurimonas gotlandica GD1]|jgi:tRNA(Ile)-lysidine synthase|uniref:tRNA(Ile)-lysidine synthase n=1 Tax=Sulfurimonas gotlandica (strain DSM 19862 / JCM 16533 / GD1) TaxID=929558 RepID=B6BIH0_SULGG|nr:tRNA lysidine(34) synthetase TilS [Sulfurimonas gotlandica]EDZ63159.1 tRNA(Ile)-lysidine synthetase [Sulfurimonas gotlandica GD1]EHP30325.1 tRNA(Ile)-lysidine synthetase [Sulfurimonas gotlandica GD1]